MKKKLCIIGILCVILYFLIKGICLYEYDINTYTSNGYVDYINKLRIGEKIIVTSNIEKSDDDFIYGNLRMKNLFPDFERIQSKQDNLHYTLKGHEKEKIGFIIQNVKTAKVEFFKKYINEAFGPNKLFYIDGEKILRDYHIETDIELIEKFVEKKDAKNHIFTSIPKMKENFAFQYMCATMFNEKIQFVDGSYQGYFVKSDTVSSLYILDDDKIYSLMFYGNDYFNDDLIQNIMNSIIIQ